jgi:hypothetical protein
LPSYSVTTSLLIHLGSPPYATSCKQQQQQQQQQQRANITLCSNILCNIL